MSMEVRIPSQSSILLKNLAQISLISSHIMIDTRDCLKVLGVALIWTKWSKYGDKFISILKVDSKNATHNDLFETPYWGSAYLPRIS